MTSDASTIVGCDAAMRYHNKRSDFSVTDATRVKVVCDGSSLIVQIDEKNSGQWKDCVTIPNLNLGKVNILL